MKKNKSPTSKKTIRKQPAKANRPLHLRITLHPISIFFLLCVGVLLIGSTYKAFGATTNVSMQITEPALDSPAVITKPTDKTTFKEPDIEVEGTCPADSYVKIYRNGKFNGAAPCNDGKFKLTISLKNGTNILQARVFNFSNQEGPESDNITVYYNPDNAPDITEQISPSPNPPSSSQTDTEPSDEAFRIITDYQYKVYESEEEVRLDLELAGGTSPYAVAVDWNDGHITPIPRKDTSPFQPKHLYDEKPRMYTYVIEVAASDLDGDTAYVQLMAVVDGSKPEPAQSTAPQTTTGISNDRLQVWLKYVWPVYIIVVLMAISFYLGEREEKRILLGRKRTPSSR